MAADSGQAAGVRTQAKDDPDQAQWMVVQLLPPSQKQRRFKR